MKTLTITPDQIAYVQSLIDRQGANIIMIGDNDAPWVGMYDIENGKEMSWSFNPMGHNWPLSQFHIMEGNSFERWFHSFTKQGYVELFGEMEEDQIPTYSEIKGESLLTNLANLLTRMQEKL